MKDRRRKTGFLLVLLATSALAFWLGRRSAQTKQAELVSLANPNTSDRASVGNTAETKQTPFEYVTEDGAITIKEYNGSSLVVTIPNMINGLPVKRIGGRAFYLSRITSITIPNGVTSIGDSAFYECGGLTSAAVPGSLITIGSHAFKDCKSLTNIFLGKNITRIGQWAFAGCSRLEYIIVPDGVTTIEENSFRDCSGLICVVIGKGVKVIESYPFADCISLQDIYFVGDAPTAGDYIFFGLKALIVHRLAGTSGWRERFHDKFVYVCKPEDIWQLKEP